MEVVEDDKNQPQITSKRIKLSKEAEEEEEEKEDRISVLPDCLLLEFISRLDSTKEAIRTGVFSKRWQHLWPQVPNLVFQYTYRYELGDFYSIVDKTLNQCRQLTINKFKLHIIFLTEFESKVKDWIHYATSRNVQDLDLSLWNISGYPRFEFDQSFFLNSCFTHFKLHSGILKPTRAISWNKLKCLFISFGKLDEDLIQNILSGSPVLETLSLDNSHGLRRLDITSKSVQNLVLSTNFDLEEINARDIRSLTVKDYLLKFMLLNVSSFVKVDLNYEFKNRYYELTPEEELEEEEMIEGLILSLRHDKEVKLGYCCCEALARLEDKGFSCPSTVKKCLIWKMDQMVTKTREEQLLEDGPKV